MVCDGRIFHSSFYSEEFHPKILPKEIGSSTSLLGKESENPELVVDQLGEEEEDEEEPPAPPSHPPVNPSRPPKDPPPGVDPQRLAKFACRQMEEAALAPQEEGPPKPKTYKAPPRPPTISDRFATA